MSYSPVLHFMSRQWMVGKIENHSARPLTQDEVDEVCKKLDGIERLRKVVESARSAEHQCFCIYWTAIKGGFYNTHDCDCNLFSITKALSELEKGKNPAEGGIMSKENKGIGNEFDWLKDTAKDFIDLVEELHKDQVKRKDRIEKLEEGIKIAVESLTLIKNEANSKRVDSAIAFNTLNTLNKLIATEALKP